MAEEIAIVPATELNMAQRQEFLKLQQEFAVLRRIPDFSFFTDGKEFEWYSKDIDNWEISKFDNVYINSMYHSH